MAPAPDGRCVTLGAAAARSLALILGIGCVLALTGCDRAVRTAFALVTDPPPRLPAEREIHDLPYAVPASDGKMELGAGDRRTPDQRLVDDPKHRYDLFLPAVEPGWPVVVFVHGGGWTSGDRDLAFGDFEVYGAIGRRLAMQGIGAAVISYRLQPSVTWREQVEDVAYATAAAADEAAARGADRRRLFVSGHSAGAQLATYAAVRGDLLAAAGVDEVCGVAAISGAGYDLADERTYALGAQRAYYEERFDTGDGWQREASAMTWLDADDPPMLLLFGREEWPSLQYQNRLLADRLGTLGIRYTLRDVRGTGHRRMVVEASDPDEPVLRSLVEFVRSTPCGDAS
ncbi:MAG: alpha/beta hydrolase [Acidobacteriota bacterium]